jgi:hypothetical protein
MEFFGVYLIAAVIVGAIAQMWKGRTGVLWAALTFPAYWFWHTVATRVPRDPGVSPGIEVAADVMFAALFAIGTMGIIVATLPRRRPPA